MEGFLQFSSFLWVLTRIAFNILFVVISAFLWHAPQDPLSLYLLPSFKATSTCLGICYSSTPVFGTKIWLVVLDCCNRIPHIRWLNQQTFIPGCCDAPNLGANRLSQQISLPYFLTLSLLCYTIANFYIYLPCHQFPLYPPLVYSFPHPLWYTDVWCLYVQLYHMLPKNMKFQWSRFNNIKHFCCFIQNILSWKWHFKMQVYYNESTTIRFSLAPLLNLGYVNMMVPE